MANPLSFLIELFDKMSGPANKISGSVNTMADSIERAHDKVGGFESTWTKLHSGLEVGRRGFEMVRGVAEGVVGVLEEIGQNQATQGIFEDILGKDEGRGVLDWLGKIRNSTAFTRDQLEGLTQPLIEFFKGDQLKNVVVAGLDVGRGSMARTEAALDTFAKVASTGKISSRAFKTLGLTTDAFKKLGAGDAGEASITIDKLLSMIAAKSGGQLGGRALQSSNTVAAKLNQIRGWTGELWERLSDSPALPRIVESLDKLGRTLTSEEVIGGLANLLEKMGEKLPDAISAAADLVTSLTPILRGVGAVLTWVGEAFSTAGTVIGEQAARIYLYFEGLFEGIAAIFNGGSVLDAVWKMITNLFDILTAPARTMFSIIGQSMVDGLVEGITGAFGAVKDAVVGLADSTVGWFKEKLGIASPSKVMMRLGGYTAEGFALGLESGAGRVDGAFSAVLSAPAVEAGAGGGGRGSLSVSFGDIIVQGGGKDSRGLGEELRQAVRQAVRDVIDEYGLKAGLVT